MLILLKPYGQTSNNFFQHINIDAFCREHNIKFYNKYIKRYGKDYPGLNLYGKNIFLNFIILLILYLDKIKAISTLYFTEKDERAKYESLIKKNKKLLICKGWYFFQSELTHKYRSEYKKLFTPDIDRSFYINKYFPDHESGNITIGVHIRRGDYEHWDNGIYFYSDEIYSKIVEQFISTLNHKCRIIIFTDDKNLNKTYYNKKFKELAFSQESVVVDHF